jgi:hypothetical protein
MLRAVPDLLPLCLVAYLFIYEKKCINADSAIL